MLQGSLLPSQSCFWLFLSLLLPSFLPSFLSFPASSFTCFYSFHPLPSLAFIYFFYYFYCCYICIANVFPLTLFQLFPFACLYIFNRNISLFTIYCFFFAVRLIKLMLIFAITRFLSY